MYMQACISGCISCLAISHIKLTAIILKSVAFVLEVDPDVNRDTVSSAVHLHVHMHVIILPT